MQAVASSARDGLVGFLREEPDAVALLLLIACTLATIAAAATTRLSRGRRGRPGCDGLARHAESQPPHQGGNAQVTTWPHLLGRELLAALVALLVICWWAIALELPLGPEADPRATPPLTKAPWFAIGLQEMLQYFDAWLAGAVLPLLALAGLCALPYLERSDDERRSAPLWRRKGALAVLAWVLILWLLPSAIGLFLRGEDWRLEPAWREPAWQEPAALIPSSPGPEEGETGTRHGTADRAGAVAAPEIADRPGRSADAPMAAAAPIAAAEGGTLGERLGLGAFWSSLLGGLLCTGPYLALLYCWPLARRGRRARRLGLARYLLGGALLLTFAGVLLKILLVLLLDIRYLWVTPWLSI